MGGETPLGPLAHSGMTLFYRHSTMQIDIGKGVGGIIFGLTEDEIHAAIGAPDKIYVTDLETRDLQYFSLKLVLKIEIDNDSRLGWIEVHNKSITFPWCNPWSTEKTELLKSLASKLGEEPEIDDYGHMESYMFAENWVELQFELGELSCINFGVLYGDDDQPLWPIQHESGR
jgi:hypothetical protein